MSLQVFRNLHKWSLRKESKLDAHALLSLYDYNGCKYEYTVKNVANPASKRVPKKVKMPKQKKNSDKYKVNQPPEPPSSKPPSETMKRSRNITEKLAFYFSHKVINTKQGGGILKSKTKKSKLLMLKSKCKFCGRKFPTNLMLRKHRQECLKRKTHTPTKLLLPKFSCDLCPIKFVSQNTLEQHIKFDHRPRPTCEKCFKIFECRRKLSDHTDLCAGTLNGKPIKKQTHGIISYVCTSDVHVCGKCENPFPSQDSLNCHHSILRKKIPIEVVREKSVEEVKSNVGKEIIFSDSQNLEIKETSVFDELKAEEVKLMQASTSPPLSNQIENLTGNAPLSDAKLDVINADSNNETKPAIKFDTAEKASTSDVKLKPIKQELEICVANIAFFGECKTVDFCENACGYCGKLFQNERRLHTHEHICTQRLSCCFCHRELFTLVQLKLHRKKCSERQRFSVIKQPPAINFARYTCPTCLQNFPLFGLYQQHTKHVHKRQVCKACGYISPYTTHEDPHQCSNKPKLKCDKCSFVCIQEKAMKKHSRIHSPRFAKNIVKSLTPKRIANRLTSIRKKNTNDTFVNQPTNDTFVNQPTNDTFVNQPTNDTFVNQPTNDTFVNQPTNDTFVNQPTNDTFVNQPSTETIINKEFIEPLSPPPFETHIADSVDVEQPPEILDAIQPVKIKQEPIDVSDEFKSKNPCENENNQPCSILSSIDDDYITRKTNKNKKHKAPKIKTEPLEPLEQEISIPQIKNSTSIVKSNKLPNIKDSTKKNQLEDSAEKTPLNEHTVNNLPDSAKKTVSEDSTIKNPSNNSTKKNTLEDSSAKKNPLENCIKGKRGRPSRGYQIPVEERTKACENCSQVLLKHLYYKHTTSCYSTESNEVMLPKKVPPCYVCGTQFDTIEAFILHLTKHSPTRPFACFQCAYRAKQLSKLQRHIKMQHKDSQTRLTCHSVSKLHYRKHNFTSCVTCCNVFIDRDDRSQHDCSGAWEKHCKKCNAVFLLKASYNNHVNKCHVVAPLLRMSTSTVVTTKKKTSLISPIQDEQELMIKPVLPVINNSKSPSVDNQDTTTEVLSMDQAKESLSSLFFDCGDEEEEEISSTKEQSCEKTVATELPSSTSGIGVSAEKQSLVVPTIKVEPTVISSTNDATTHNEKSNFIDLFDSLEREAGEQSVEDSETNLSVTDNHKKQLTTSIAVTIPEEKQITPSVPAATQSEDLSSKATAIKMCTKSVNVIDLTEDSDEEEPVKASPITTSANATPTKARAAKTTARFMISEVASAEINEEEPPLVQQLFKIPQISMRHVKTASSSVSTDAALLKERLAKLLNRQKKMRPKTSPQKPTVATTITSVAAVMTPPLRIISMSPQAIQIDTSPPSTSPRAVPAKYLPPADKTPKIINTHSIRRTSADSRLPSILNVLPVTNAISSGIVPTTPTAGAVTETAILSPQHPINDTPEVLRTPVPNSVFATDTNDGVPEIGCAFRMFPCRVCHISFGSEQLLQAHMAHNHTTTTAPSQKTYAMRAPPIVHHRPPPLMYDPVTGLYYIAPVHHDPHYAMFYPPPHLHHPLMVPRPPFRPPVNVVKPLNDKNNMSPRFTNPPPPPIDYFKSPPPTYKPRMMNIHPSEYTPVIPEYFSPKVSPRPSAPPNFHQKPPPAYYKALADRVRSSSEIAREEVHQTTLHQEDEPKSKRRRKQLNPRHKV